MLDSVIILEKIIIDPPAAKIYSRLGFKKKITSLSSSRQKETDRHIEEAASIIRLQGSFLRLPISKNDGQDISLDEQTTFQQHKTFRFSSRLPGSRADGGDRGQSDYGSHPGENQPG